MKAVTIAAIVAVALIGSAFALLTSAPCRVLGFCPSATKVIGTTLVSVQEMNQLTVFSATLLSVVTTKEIRPGPFDRMITLITPGTVRYDVNFAGLRDRDLVWNAESKILRVSVPELLISSPDMDPVRAQVYRAGFAIPGSSIDESLMRGNWIAARKSIKKQAAQNSYLAMAHRSARAAIASNFELPLRAAGVDAHVVVRFPGEA